MRFFAPHDWPCRGCRMIPSFVGIEGLNRALADTVSYAMHILGEPFAGVTFETKAVPGIQTVVIRFGAVKRFNEYLSSITDEEKKSGFSYDQAESIGVKILNFAKNRLVGGGGFLEDDEPEVSCTVLPITDSVYLSITANVILESV